MEKIKVQGMSCQHCVMAVTKALGGIDGIRDVKVDLEKGTIETADGKKFSARPFPPFMLEIIKAGGLMNYVRMKKGVK